MPVNQVEEWYVYIPFKKPLTEKSKTDIEQLIWCMFGSTLIENGDRLAVNIDGFTDQDAAKDLETEVMQLVEYEE